MAIVPFQNFCMKIPQAISLLGCIPSSRTFVLLLEIQVQRNWLWKPWFQISVDMSNSHNELHKTKFARETCSCHTNGARKKRRLEQGDGSSSAERKLFELHPHILLIVMSSAFYQFVEASRSLLFVEASRSLLGITISTG